MEELQAAVTAHLDQVSGLVQALSSELRRGMGPAADNLRGFIRAVDWTVFSPDPLIGDRIRITKTLLSFLSLSLPPPSRADKYRALRLCCALNVLLFQEPWLMCLMAFHVVLLLTAVGFRRNANFQLFLLFLACESFIPSVITKHALHISKYYIVAEGKSIRFHQHSTARIAQCR
jgi:hypothetical protein